MKTIIAPLAGFAFLALGAGLASAASPAYCALYAKEYARHAALEGQGSAPTDFVHDRAYHKCLNLDDEPALPTAYTEAEAAAIGGPFVPIEEEGSADAASEAASTATPASAAATRTSSAGSGERGSSGLVRWSAEWKAWCKAHYPNSFDEATGTVIPLDTGKRRLCN